MYCPNCSSQNKRKQNFCRYCGLYLPDIEKTFSDGLVFGEETKRLKNLRDVRKITDYAQFYSVVSVFIGIIGLIFFDSGISRILMTAGLLSFFLAQAIREIFGYFQRQNSRESNGRGAANNAERRDFKARETNKLIEEKPFVPVPSVTENSTELLFVEYKSKNSE